MVNKHNPTDLQESSEHNFALKQIASSIVSLKKRRDDYYTDPDCPINLIDSFNFVLDALNILEQEVRDFNQHCTKRRHSRPKLRAVKEKETYKRIVVR